MKGVSKKGRYIEILKGGGNSNTKGGGRRGRVKEIQKEKVMEREDGDGN